MTEPISKDKLDSPSSGGSGGLVLYIIRHGETDLNKRGIVQGRGLDTVLNEHGKLQADAFFAAYKHIPFDKIYTSTLKRTHQTVDKFIKLNIPWVQYPGLDELAWGIFEGRESTLETMAAFRETLQNWTQGNLDFKFEGGESPNEVKSRQLDVITMLKQSTDKNILICMHGRALRLFLCSLTGIPLTEMDQFPHHNTCLYKVFYDGINFSIIDFNNTDHLRYLIPNNLRE